MTTTLKQPKTHLCLTCPFILTFSFFLNMKGPKQKGIISLEIVAYWDYSFIFTHLLATSVAVFRCTDLLTISCVSLRENQIRSRRLGGSAPNQNGAQSYSHTYPSEESRSFVLSLRGYVCEHEWVHMIGGGMNDWWRRGGKVL